MLQQTQVKTVIPYWNRWMQVFPTVKDLAQAPLDEVLKLWSGLGYYSRARNLRRAAIIILTEWGGRMPRQYSDLLALPGIGRYTAGAICSIAFNQPLPVVDGNVARVLSRILAVPQHLSPSQIRELLWSWAGDLVRHADKISTPGTRPCSALNQSLMELGATACTPRQPDCPRCPVRSDCLARLQGTIDQVPNPRPKVLIQDRQWMCFIVAKHGRFLLRRRPSHGVNAQLWEFPNTEISQPDLANPLAAARSVVGVVPTDFKLLGTIQHRITRYRFRLSVFRIEIPGTLPASNRDRRWMRPGELPQAALAGAHRRIASQFLGLPMLRHR